MCLVHVMKCSRQMFQFFLWQIETPFKFVLNVCYCASYSLDGTNTQIKHFKDQNRTIDDQFEHLEKKNRILGNKGFFFIQSYSLSQHPGLVMCHWRQVMVIVVVTVGLESTTQQFHTLSKWKKCFSHTNTLRLRLKKTTWNEIWMKNTTDVHVNLSFCILHCNGKQWRMFCLWVSVCLILFYLKYVLLTHSSPVRCTPSFNIFTSALHWPQHVSVHLLHVSCFKVLSQRNHVTLSMSLWMNGESFYKHGWISHSSSGHLCWFWKDSSWHNQCILSESLMDHSLWLLRNHRDLNSP